MIVVVDSITLKEAIEFGHVKIKILLTQEAKRTFCFVFQVSLSFFLGW